MQEIDGVIEGTQEDPHLGMCSSLSYSCGAEEEIQQERGCLCPPETQTRRISSLLNGR